MAGHNYKAVIIGKTFFLRKSYEGVLTPFRADLVPRSRHVLEGLLKNAEAVPFLLSISL
jgi:hypothetical protein